jgi:hypothetical protein
MRRIGLAIGVCVALAGSASAQDANKVELSGGYRYYHATLPTVYRPSDFERPNDFSKGWYFDVVTNVSEKFAIVGDVGGSYFSKDFARTSGSFASNEVFTFSLHSFAGGLRIRAPQKPALVPFGQILFGGQHHGSKDERTSRFGTSAPSTFTTKTGTSGAMLTLESGVILTAGPIGIRAATGYSRMFGKSDADAVRLSVGAVYGF